MWFWPTAQGSSVWKEILVFLSQGAKPDNRWLGENQPFVLSFPWNTLYCVLSISYFCQTVAYKWEYGEHTAFYSHYYCSYIRRSHSFPLPCNYVKFRPMLAATKAFSGCGTYISKQSSNQVQIFFLVTTKQQFFSSITIKLKSKK